MPRIKFNLSEKSIAEALKQVREYHNKVKNADVEIVKIATEMGAEQAKEEALYMEAYDTGELVRGIKAEQQGNKGRIVSTAPHSMFVEMGTGIRGKQEPNPGDYLPGWTYDVNEHGEYGWWYTGKDGQRHWTKGMPSRPFMYHAANALKESIPYIVEGVLKDS